MNQTIGVNITPQSFQPTLHYSQGDVGRVFVINVTDYDIPTGATVTCVATKPSGMGFTVSGTVSGNSVTFTSTAEMTDEWGRFPAEIRIASGNTLLGTANFLMIGEKDPHPASTIDGTQEELIPQLTLLVNRVEAAAESVHDLTVSATTLTAGSDATATYDSTNNSIAFGIPRGADGDVTRSEFNDLKSDLGVLLHEDITPISLTEITGCYPITTKEFWPNTGYKCAIIQATPTDKIYVTAKSNTNIPIAVFYSGTPSSTTYIGYYGNASSEQVYEDVLLEIPSGTTHIVLNNRITSPIVTLGAKKTVIEISDLIRNGKIYAQRLSDGILLKTKYTSTSDIVFKIRKCGGNSLVDFDEIQEINANGETIFTFTNQTDWFGPYKVRAESNADGDLPSNWYSHFVGGNHQYSNSGSGSTPTARCVIDGVYFDNNSASVGDEQYCDRVDFCWTNYIQGQNTKKADGTGREILKETYCLTFDGFAFEVEHSFEPLEDVLISTYYGLQEWWSIQGVTETYQFVGGTNRNEKTFPASTDITSGDKNCTGFYIKDSLNNFIEMKLGNTDLDKQIMNNSDSSAFANANKLYFRLVFDSSFPKFSAGNRYFNTGKIRFCKLP